MPIIKTRKLEDFVNKNFKPIDWKPSNDKVSQLNNYCANIAFQKAHSHFDSSVVPETVASIMF